MQDVAIAAGVDKATVSRVLKGDHRISEKTRIRVMESVRGLGYRPDRNASNLSTKSSGLIGVVVRDFNMQCFPSFIAGLDRTLSNSEYELIIKCTGDSPMRAVREFGRLADRKVEGIIWFDSVNIPADTALPILTLGFRINGCFAILPDPDTSPPTFELGAMAGRFILNIISGKPIPSREIVVKCRD